MRFTQAPSQWADLPDFLPGRKAAGVKLTTHFHLPPRLKMRDVQTFPQQAFMAQTEAATLTEVFPCFFLGCKANARLILAKTGHGPHSSKILVLFYVLFVLYCSMYCLFCIVLCIVCV